MSCNFPKVAYQKEKGDKLIFVPTFDKEDLYCSLSELAKKYTWYARHCDELLNAKKLIIPCGQCVECRLQRSREMATRIVLETGSYIDNWAITLTYDQEYLSYSKKTGRATLVPEDLTKFMKDLRRYFKYHYNAVGIRFYAAAEYGSKSARPHFHLILFNFPIPASDIRLCRHEKSQTGEDLFESDIISAIWGKGRVRLNTVTWNYAAYCARYIMKKQLGKNSDMYEILDIVPEFCRMSNRPGLGYDFLQKNKDKIIHDGDILVKIKDKSVRVPIPKYFIKKITEDGTDLTELLDFRQQQATNYLNNQINSYNADIFEVLRSLDSQSVSKSKGLPRL